MTSRPVYGSVDGQQPRPQWVFFGPWTKRQRAPLEDVLRRYVRDGDTDLWELRCEVVNGHRHFYGKRKGWTLGQMGSAKPWLLARRIEDLLKGSTHVVPAPDGDTEGSG